MSDEIQEELWLIVEALNKKRQFQLQSGAGGRSREARLENPLSLAEAEVCGPPESPSCGFRKYTEGDGQLAYRNPIDSQRGFA